jgi:preprotein translocase subunit SecD
MKGNNGVRFFAIIIIIGILTWIAWNGELLGYKIPGARDITLGIDVKGGVDATLTGTHKDGSAPTTDEMDTAKKIISIRLDNDGITDKVITSDNTTHRIIVQIPWKSDEKDFNPQATIDKAVQTAMLTFREVDDTKKDKNGNYLPLDDKIILQGSTDIKGASPQINQSGGTDVSLVLTDAGIKKFAEATARLVGKPIAIFLDSTFISDPIVNVAIPDGQAIIQLGGDAKSQQAEAKNLADIIRSGALPFSLKTLSVNSISPQLGMNALNTMYRAGLVALLLVCLFMLFYYRLPGIIACVALIGHTTIQLLMISWMQLTNLTLPGLAGIVLTIGMGVDANIIIFERIKEELRNGKTLRAAIDVGFKRAFSAIFDANMTTLIAAVVLWVFGSGTLKGFAYTLGLGVVLSFLTAVLVSRLLLKSAADLNIAKHRWLYGVKEVAK